MLPPSFVYVPSYIWTTAHSRKRVIMETGLGHEVVRYSHVVVQAYSHPVLVCY